MRGRPFIAIVTLMVLMLTLGAGTAHANLGDLLFYVVDPRWNLGISLAGLPLGDLNQDGYGEFAILQTGPLDAGAGMRYYRGSESIGPNPFFTYQPSPDSVQQISSGGQIGDVNGDGYEDWFIHLRPHDWQECWYYVIFSGGLDMGAPPIWSKCFHYETRLIDIGDFNGDGFDDIYTWREELLDVGRLYLGGVQPDTAYSLEFASPPDIPGVSRLEGRGDLNGDGCDDAFSAPWSPWLVTFFFGSSPPDTVADISWINFDASRSTIIQDMNGDQCDEFVVWYDDSLSVHWGGPVLHRVAPTRLATRPTRADHIASGDVNGDGYGDIITSFDGGYVQIHLGSRWPSPWPVYSRYEGDFDYIRVLGLGDVNGDGADDWCISGRGGPGDHYYFEVHSGDPNYVVPVERSSSPIADNYSITAYPNPFNAQSTIAISMPTAEISSLVVYDLLGRQVATLSEGRLMPGHHRFVWDASDLASGTYLVSAETNAAAHTHKIILLK